MRIVLLVLTAATALALSAAAQTLVVGNKEADTAGFIDLARGEMVAARATGRGPHEVAVSPDGMRAAVVAYGTGDDPGRTISLFGVQSATALKVVDLGGHTRPHGIVWLPDGRHLAVTTEGSGHLAIVDADSGTVVDAIETGARGSHMLALSPDGRRAYVANLGGRSMSVVDLESRTLKVIVPAGEGSEGIAVTPDGKEIWLSNRGEDTVFVFDAGNFAQIARLETGRVPIRVAISPDGRHAAVSNAGDGSVMIFDVATKEIAATVPLSPSSGANGLPVTLLFAPDGGTLYAALTNAAEIAVVDTAGWTQTGLIPAGAGSDGLGYSPLALDLGG